MKRTALTTVSNTRAHSKRPPPPAGWYSLEFLRPLAEWYSYMSPSQMMELPPRVSNALDSLKEFMGRKPDTL